MNWYNTKLVYRNSTRHKRFFTVSIISLAIGMAISALLWLHINYENSYDKFYKNSENLYRVSYTVHQNGKQIIHSARTQSALSTVLPQESSLIVASSRALWELSYMYTDKVKLFDQNVVWADSSFINVFQHKMILGNASTALINNYSVVISEKVAKLYFGDANPIDEIIMLNEGLAFTVTGVYKTMPEQTHMYYDFIVSLSTWSEYGMRMEGDWRAPSFCTYIRTKNEVSTSQIENTLKVIADKYLSNKDSKGQKVKFSLLPVKDIYPHSNLEGEFSPQGNHEKVSLLAIIAMFMIGIAWVNNVNISTALSFERAKENGIRKLNGAGNGSLIAYFVTESFYINLAATVIASLIFIGSYTMFESLVDGAIDINFIQHRWFWKGVILFFLISLFFTGVIPALLQTMYSPLHILKNKTNEKYSLNSFRKSLVVFQLSLAIILIVCTFMIFRQLRYLESQDLGIKAEQVLVFRGPATNNSTGGRRYQEFRAFRNDLLQVPSFKSITASTNIPGQKDRSNDILVSMNGQEIEASFNFSEADENYFATYQVPILAGRNFYDNIQNERLSVVVSQQAIAALGIKDNENAIGKKIVFAGNERIIVGVVKDFHQESLQKIIEPYIYVFRHPSDFGYYISLVSTGNINTTIADAKMVWMKHYPNALFDCFFLDAFFKKQYSSYHQLGKLVGVSSLLSIIIACLGLFALVSYTINKKIKEIGVRKVNGANITEILTILNKDFVKWVAIAFVIACPISYYAMHRWLENFAYKTELSWWIFALAGLLALGIVLLTVSWQSWKAATRNPVEALRYE